MNPYELDQLTLDYRKAAAREWAILRTGSTEFPLNNVFVLLEAIFIPSSSPLDQLPELAPLTERLQHIGQAAGKSYQSGFNNRTIRSTQHLVSIEEALNTTPHIALLGEPGSGKTTTLQFIGLTYVNNNITTKKIMFSDARQPVRLFLRQHGERIAQESLGLEEACIDEIASMLRCQLQTVQELFESWRISGQLLLLLDGFDEVIHTSRERVARAIGRFIGTNDSLVRLVITSRPSGYIIPLGLKDFNESNNKFREYFLKPFGGPDEVKPFLAAWLGALKIEWKGQENEIANELLLALQRQPALNKLLDNPLLLQMAAEVYTMRGEVAQNRSGLYYLWVEALWSRALERGINATEKDNILTMLEDLAWNMINLLPLQKNEEKLEVASKGIGIVARLGKDWVFNHQTVLEYFVALHLKRAWDHNRQKTWRFLKPRLHLPEWREPILLLSASLDKENAQRLVNQVLTARSKDENRLERDLELATALLDEGVQLHTWNRQFLLIWAGWQLSMWRQLFRFARVSFLLMLIYFYILFSGPQPMRDLIHANIYFTALIIALPVYINFFFINQNWKIKNWRKKSNFIASLSKEGEKDQVWLNILSWKPQPSTSIWVDIARLTKGKKILRAWLKVLFWKRQTEIGVWNEDGGYLSRYYQHDNTLITVSGRHVNTNLENIRTLAGRKTSEIIPSLILFLQNEDWQLRELAADILGDLKATEAVPALMNVLQDNAFVRRAAAQALGKIQAKVAVPVLLSALQESESWVRVSIIEALGNIGDPKSIHALQDSIHDQTPYISTTAASALGMINSSETIPLLVNSLRNKNKNIRLSVASALGNHIEALPIYALKRLRKISQRDKEIEALLPSILERLQRLKLFYFDPVLSIKQAKYRTVTISIALLLASTLTIALYDLFINILGDQIGNTLNPWIDKAPTWLSWLVLSSTVIIIASIGFMLGRWLDNILDRQQAGKN